jgi:hypothetical protein
MADGGVVESMFYTAVRLWLAREHGIAAEEVVCVEQDTVTDWQGYSCETTSVVLEITYRLEGYRSTNALVYDGNFAEFIRALG